MAKRVRYWDSDVCIAWLAQESERVPLCRPVIEGAERGRLLIATSAMTLTEVIKLKSRTRLPPEKWKLAETFFHHEWMTVRNLDRYIAERARALIWEYNLSQKDAVHVATAVRWKLPRMDTFDGELIGHSGRFGDPPLVIGEPDLPQQLDLEMG